MLLPKRYHPRTQTVVVVEGGLGVGKTFLVEQFAALHSSKFVGGIHTLRLDRRGGYSVDDLAWTLASQLDVDVQVSGSAPWHELGRRLGKSLLHIENVDDQERAELVTALVKNLPSSPIVITARWRGLGKLQRWTRIPLDVFTREEAVQFLEKALPEARITVEKRSSLADKIGFLPAALELAAARLSLGQTVDGCLRSLLDDRDQETALKEEFRRSLDMLQQRLARNACRGNSNAWAQEMMGRFRRMGFVTPGGVGAGLGAEMTGLCMDDFEYLMMEAARLSLTENRPDDARPEGAWRVNGFLAGMLRAECRDLRWADGMEGWFLARLSPEAHPGTERQTDVWEEVRAELPSLFLLIQSLVPERATRLAAASAPYAMLCGPVAAWLTIFEQVAARSDDTVGKADLRLVASRLAHGAGEVRRGWEMLDLARADGGGGEDDNDFDRMLKLTEAAYLRESGQMDEADAAIQSVLSSGGESDLSRDGGLLLAAYRAWDNANFDLATSILRDEILSDKEGDHHDATKALALVKIADIERVKGNRGEARRLLQNDALPFMIVHGENKESAVIRFKLIELLEEDGLREAALQTLETELLPICERIGVERLLAMVRGKRSDLLASLGRREEAKKVLLSEVLPVFERLHDVREHAVALGRLANLELGDRHFGRAEALLRKEVIPVLERLNDVRALVACRVNLALALALRDFRRGRSEVRRLLRQSRGDAVRLGLRPDIDRIVEMERTLGFRSR